MIAASGSPANCWARSMALVRARFEPAVGGDQAVLGVDAQGQLAGKLAAHLRGTSRALSGPACRRPAAARPSSSSVRSSLRRECRRRVRRERRPPRRSPRTAGRLAVEPSRAPSRSTRCRHVGPLADPAAGHRGRVVAVDGFPLIVALLQADALAAAKINGRPDLHSPGSSPCGSQPARSLRIDENRRICHSAQRKQRLIMSQPWALQLREILQKSSARSAWLFSG